MSLFQDNPDAFLAKLALLGAAVGFGQLLLSTDQLTLRTIIGRVLVSARLVEDLRLDSLSRLTLAIEIEDHFRIRLDDEDESEIETVADLVAAIRSRLAA